MAVGAADVEELRRFRAQRYAERGESWVYTRNHPRRAEEVLAGGSLYWVVKGQIRARHRVIGFRSERDDNGRTYCLILTDPELVLTTAARVSAVPGLALFDAGRCAKGCPRRPRRRFLGDAGPYADRIARIGPDLG